MHDTMRPKEDPCRDPASEARDDRADAEYEMRPVPDDLNIAISDNLFDLLGDPARLPLDEVFAAEAPRLTTYWRQEFTCATPDPAANLEYVDAPYESYCCKIDPKTGEFVSTTAKSEDEERLFFDPDDLEGRGLTDEERAANYRALSKLTVQERFALMFRGPKPDPDATDH